MEYRTCHVFFLVYTWAFAHAALAELLGWAGGWGGQCILGGHESFFSHLPRLRIIIFIFCFCFCFFFGGGGDFAGGCNFCLHVRRLNEMCVNWVYHVSFPILYLTLECLADLWKHMLLRKRRTYALYPIRQGYSICVSRVLACFRRRAGSGREKGEIPPSPFPRIPLVADPDRYPSPFSGDHPHWPRVLNRLQGVFTEIG